MGIVEGKVALVTGGTRGIGAATAAALVREGAQVVIADIRPEVEETAARLGDAVSAVRYDARDADSIARLLDTVLERHGRLDILHNNAAVTDEAWTNDRAVADIDVDFWDLTMAVNLRGTFIASKLALPHLLRDGGGAIVNMASIAALRGSMALPAYGTSKAGIVAFTRYLAVQYGREGVRANCIAPGVILTENVTVNAPRLEQATLQALPHTRGGSAEDIAETVVFLASARADYVNGELITVDGGLMAGTAAPR